MRARGITYDTGFFGYGATSRESFDLESVRRDLRVIRDDLHCTAVRVTGSDVDRLDTAAQQAADLGLEVWISPFTSELTTDEMLKVLADLADRAERIRLRGTEVVLVTDGEISLFNRGFLPGGTCFERIALVGKRDPSLAGLPGRVNDFLGKAAAVVRERFGGKISYASIHFEGVDWTPFDFIGVDLYRTAEVADRFAEGVRSLVAQGKPVAITEFGCCTFRGAADLGASGGGIVEYDGPTPVRLNGDYVRDEDEQARYLRELLDVFTAEGVDTAFAYTFANFHLPHRSDPRVDLDIGGWGIVKVPDDAGTWEPKAAFTALAEYYG